MYFAEEPEDENYAVGEEAIERAAAGMGGKTVAPPVTMAVQQLMGSPGGVHRRAAVAALARLAEGTSNVLRKNHWELALSVLSAGLGDASQRVQYQALQSLGQFAGLFPDDVPELLRRFGGNAIGLLHANSSCARVRGHAASCLISLIQSDECSAEVLAPFLEPILQSLVACLQSPLPPEVQAPCVDLIGYVPFRTVLLLVPADLVRHGAVNHTISLS